MTVAWISPSVAVSLNVVGVDPEVAKSDRTHLARLTGDRLMEEST